MKIKTKNTEIKDNVVTYNKRRVNKKITLPTEKNMHVIVLFTQGQSQKL